MTKIKFLILLLAAVTLAACGGATTQSNTGFPPEPPPLPDSVDWNGDPDLAPLLRRSAFSMAQVKAAEELDAQLGRPYIDRQLALIVEDTANPAVVRINALTLLSQRLALDNLIAFNVALAAPEERVRMAAVSGMRNFLAITPTAVRILEKALHDPNPRIQARALELLADRDVRVLRDYSTRVTNPDLREVTRGLIMTAEARGAPLVPIDSAGTLQRTTDAGVVITFRPTTRWPQWDASVGELFVTVAGSRQPVLVASNVEVVGNVVPAFVAGDSALLVYEVNREIRVRSLRDQSDRKLADGIAPRIMPFTTDVLFYRQQESSADNSILYQVIRIPVTGGNETSVGQVVATARQLQKGNYSPVRWSRIREVGDRYYLVGDGMKNVELPSPFGG